MLPTTEALRFLPSFLQQLEMESNGKTVGRDGLPLSCHDRNPIVWGEIGSNGQHAFFQLLHQGGWLIPSDFIASAHSDYPLPGHQAPLMANFLAQSCAGLRQDWEAEARSELQAAGARRQDRRPAAPQGVRRQPAVHHHPAAALSPYHLGMLLAPLHEHKVFVQGVVGDQLLRPVGRRARQAARRRLLPALCG